MGSQVLASSDRSRTYWTPPMERYFIDLMLDQVHRGNRIGHTFNKQAWMDMLTMFNAKFGTKYDKDVLKGRYKNLWEQYNDVKILLEQSGFAWDETRQMVTAADYNWDAYIKTHPDARSYKTKPVLNFSDLCVIYGYTTADGRYSFSSHDVDLDDDIQGMKIGDRMVSQTPTSIDRSRTYWTPTMDRFFVDLMLDQENRGNKIDHTFNKQAWTEMIVLFNEKFESKHNKNVLRSRYKILRKHYSDMKVLLSQSGFSLDQSRQMVIADDSVWDAYTKAHPDARSCRTTTVPDFNDLYMIYGNEIADGRKVRSADDVDFENDIPGMKIGEGKDTQIHTSCDRSRTYWTPPMDRYLIDLLLDQVHKGNKIDNTFIAHAWTDMTALFNVKFGSQHDKDVLKNRYKSLRKQHNDIKVILDQNGFAWDETRQMVRADDSVWDAYIKVHPDARSYRIKIVPHYNELCTICGSNATNGRYIRLDHGIDHKNDVLGMRIGEDMGCQDPINYDSSATYWTPPMERYFIDLMLEQTHEGNKIAHTFNKEAWLVMTTLFNANFGSQYEEDALRNQYKYLWKQYNDAHFLLAQSGFSWDESQQMIVADDDVWNTYIQTYPDIQSYRTTTVPSYSDLCLIYGNETDDGRNSCPYDDADLNDDVARVMVGEGMDSQAPTICDGSRTYWTPSMDRHFIDLMLEQVHKGSKIDHTFTKQAWTGMVALFNAQFGAQHDKDVLRSRFKNLRKQYNDIKILLDNSGFAWDETRQMVTADDDTWDAYLKVHPDARSYINKTVPDYSSLRVIYENETVNRKNSHSGGHSELNDDIPTTKTGRDNMVFTTCDRSRTYWTPPMDRYFIDLMLEQVQRGNKIDHTFNKQAWMHMITLFNVKFGSQYDKDVLKSRCKNLRKQYNYIKVLLNQNGFGWDDTRQMVTANDDVWDAYIKIHPDAQSYRTKILANYNDLCVIFGNGNADGRENHSDLDSDMMGVKIDGVSGGLQSSATSIYLRDSVNDLESTSHSGKEMVISNQQNKRRSLTPSTSQHSRKVRRRTKNGMVDALSEMTEVITSLANNNKDNGNSISVENVMNALQAVPDLDEDLILDACDLLEDEKKAKTFLALDVTLRKKWLIRKLRA